MYPSYSFHNLFLYNPYSDSTYSHDYCYVDYELHKYDKFIFRGTYHLEERVFSSYKDAEVYALQTLHNHLSDILHKPFIENQSKIMRDCFNALQESSEGMFFYDLSDFLGNNYTHDDIEEFILNLNHLDPCMIEYNFDLDNEIVITCYGDLMTIFSYSNTL